MKKLAEKTHNTTYIELDELLVKRIKQLILDRIGCYLGSYKLGLHKDLLNIIKNCGGIPEASIWMDGKKIPAHNAALIIGTISSRIEFDSHDSVVTTACVVGEMLNKDGKSIITAIASGLFVKKAISELITSSIESHGIHWPSFVSVFPAATVTSMLLDGSPDEIARALSFSGSLCPVSPFESFTQGAQVKDFYGGWGDMIGILSARFSRINCYGGPLTLIEGKRGLGRAFHHGFLKKEVLEKTIQNCKSLKASDINIKPFPTCTSVHPTLTVLEKLLIELPEIDLEKIKRVDVKTYNYAVELSNESNMNKPISLKLNIPFLSAVMLLNRTVNVEDTEIPFIMNKSIQDKIMKLSKKIRVNTITSRNLTLNERKRPAIVEILMEDGKRYQKMVSAPKWRGTDNIPNGEIEDKFSMLSRNVLSEQIKEIIIKKVWDLENIKDISTLIKNFASAD